MVTVEQIRAARALLGWSQSELADQAGLSQTGIARIESGAHRPNTQTQEKIQRAFDGAGIVFTAHGVEHYKDHIVFLDSFIDVLNDAEKTLKDDDEILFQCADERRNMLAVTEKFTVMRKRGMRLRFTCCSGNHDITGDPSGYRWIDPEFHADSEVSVIYADKFALHVVAEQDRNIFMLIKNRDLASAMRRQFEYWWRKGNTWEKEIIELK